MIVNMMKENIQVTNAIGYGKTPIFKDYPGKNGQTSAIQLIFIYSNRII